MFGDSLGALADLGGLAAGVVVQAQFGSVVVAKVEEEVGLKIKTDGEGSEDVLVDAVAALIEGLHGLTEARNIGLVGPAVGVQVILDGSDIERFLVREVSMATCIKQGAQQ